MKNLKIPLFILSLLLILSLLGFALERYVAGISFSDFSPFKSREESAYTIAEEIGDLYLLNTSEYRVKLIFPYDFINRDVDWRQIKYLFEQNLEPEESERNQLEIYRSCLDAGIDPAVDNYNFIILTAVVKAGINISGTAYDNPQFYDKELLSQFISINDHEMGKSISLFIPDAGITEYYIEDRKTDNDNFPDAELTPGQWRDLVNFLNPRIVDKVIDLGILDNAGENNRILIEKILKDSGFTKVSFTGNRL